MITALIIKGLKVKVQQNLPHILLLKRRNVVGSNDNDPFPVVTLFYSPFSSFFLDCFTQCVNFLFEDSHFIPFGHFCLEPLLKKADVFHSLIIFFPVMIPLSLGIS